ncbi:DNA adenine methylase [Alkalinema pantanalense CENA528]|uniref:DNA adenine methylase n=1 Tax=Alkalinema pantanalense TaxID=1620705 RepID=UPI003D6E60B4
MFQIELFDSKIITKNQDVVNVSSVPQRSPFRYAGGKTWLIPKIRKWLHHQDSSDKELIEPFAGGGIVSLTAVCENLVDRVTMVEKDEDVAAVWKVILNGGAEWLGDAIVHFQLTPESARKAIDRASESLESRAFATIIRNRVNRGGILANGASFIKNGENGKGITSRWYPETLKKRILAIDQIKHKINFIEGDAFEVCKKNASRDDVVFFIDPPYIKAGQRLYRYSDINHEALFVLVHRLKGNFLMTYDNDSKVQELADRCNFETKLIAMKNTHHAKKTELIIGKDLTWL